MCLICFCLSSDSVRCQGNQSVRTALGVMHESRRPATGVMHESRRAATAVMHESRCAATAVSASG